ncbi:MAG: flagellar hook-basal body complex protein [bacterium]
MLRSLYAGVGGIKNHQVRMDVIGNNIANVNTVGFKYGRVQFQDILSQTISGAARPEATRGGVNPKQVGLGVTVGAIDNLMLQGNLQATGVPLDLAISGDGFFILDDGTGTGGYVYTRNGAFRLDSDGNLVNADGLFVQGWQGTIDGQGNYIIDRSAFGGIRIQKGQKMAARATTEISLESNLNSNGLVFNVWQSSPITIGGVPAVRTTALNAIFTSSVNIAISGTRPDGSAIPPGTTIAVAGNDIDDLLTAIEAALNNTVDATIDFDGRIIVTDLAGGPTQTVINLTPSDPTDPVVNFANTTVGTAEVHTTSRIVYDNLGTAHTLSLAFTQHLLRGSVTLANVGDTYNVSAQIGGKSVAGSFTGSANIYAVAENIQEILGLPDGAVTVTNAAAGTIEIVGANGSGQLITDLQIVNATNPGVDIYMGPAAANNNWVWVAGVKSPAELGTSPTAVATVTSDIIRGGAGRVTFNSDGSLATFTYSLDPDDGAAAVAPTTISFRANTGATEPVNIAVDPGTISGIDGISQFASPSTTQIASQNGWAMGDLQDISIDQSGIIVGGFTNGRFVPLAQVSLADFNNPGGLSKVAATLFAESNNSGAPRIGEAGTAGLGTINGGTLEMSNVDLSEQFTDMIVTQRGYQANAKTIQTSDEMLQTLLTLKR